MKSSESAPRATSDFSPSSLKPSPVLVAVVLSSNGSNSARRLLDRERGGRNVVADDAPAGRCPAGPSRPRGRSRWRRRPARGRRRRGPCRRGPSASVTSAEVTAERSETAPPSSSGTPSIVMPELVGLTHELGGRGAGVVRLERGLAEVLLREVADRLAHHRLLVVGRQVEEVGANAGRLAGGLAVARDLREGPPRGAGGAKAALRRAVDDALGALAKAEPVEHVAAGDRGQGPEPERHSFVCNCQVRAFPTSGRFLEMPIVATRRAKPRRMRTFAVPSCQTRGVSLVVQAPVLRPLPHRHARSGRRRLRRR